MPRGTAGGRWRSGSWTGGFAMRCTTTIDWSSVRWAVALAAVLTCGWGSAHGEDSAPVSSEQFGFLETPEPEAGEWASAEDWHVELGPAEEGDHAAGYPAPHGMAWGHVGQGISRDPGQPRKPRHEKPGDINRGDSPPLRYGIDPLKRAGWPNALNRLAKPSVSSKYECGYVGGGAAFGGRSRCACEGVWGMDYRGRLPHRRIWLRWTDGESQGGEGVYQTDGHVEPSLPGLRH